LTSERALDAGIRAAIGDAYLGLFVYGAQLFPNPDRWRTDLDFHVLVARTLTDLEISAVEAMHTILEDGWPRLVEHARSALDQ